MPPYLHLPTHLTLGLSLPKSIAFRTIFLKSSLQSVTNQYIRPIFTTPRRYKDEMGLDDWKERAPYRIHENTDDFKVRYEASCHCGRVKYQLSREKPLDAKYCHCTTCQRLHGAPFQWAAIFHKEDINFTHGHHDLGWYDSSEKTTKHKLPCKVSCAYCRAPIMDEGRNMILLFPTLIHFNGNEKDKANFAPSCHMFYTHRVVDIPDGKPKWTGINGESELIEDSPKDLKRKRDAEIEKEKEEKKKEETEQEGAHNDSA